MLTNRYVRATVSFLAAIFMIGYVAVMAYRYNYTPYKTETALTYSMADSYTAQAAFIRSEVVIDNVSGVLSYRADNAQMVLSGAVVADIFSGESDIERQKQIEELQQQIDYLRAAENATYSGINTVDVISQQIEDHLEIITQEAAYGRIGNVHTEGVQLTHHMNRKQIAVGRERDYATRIAALDGELTYLLQNASAARGSISAPETGYFSSKTDGYEAQFHASYLSLMDDEEVARLITGQVLPTGVGGAGKIVTDHKIYLAVQVDSEIVGRFTEGSQVRLDFSNDSALNIAAQVLRSRPLQNGEYIVYLQLSDINDYLLAQRTATVTVKFKTLSGIRLPTSAVRYNGPVAGTYVLSYGRILFKPIEILYEEPGFVLCKPADVTDSTPLKMYDQVIVQGTDLYDGKVVG